MSVLASLAKGNQYNVHRREQQGYLAEFAVTGNNTGDKHVFGSHRHCCLSDWVYRASD